MLYLFIITLLMFQGALINISSIFNNLDELIIVLLFVMMFIKNKINKKNITLKKYEVISCISMIIFFMIGMISYNINSSEKKYVFSFLSGVSIVKSIVFYFISRLYLKDKKFNKSLLLKYDKLLGLILSIYFIIAIINIQFNFLKSDGIRNGFNSISIGFTHPAIFEFFIICIMSIRLFINVFYIKSLKKFNITLIQSVILIFLAGRNKGIAFIGAFILFYIIVKKLKKFKVKYIFMMAPIMIYLAYDRIIVSLFSSKEARSVLYRTAFKIANDKFPLGSGFSTFGTDFSRIRYSQVYYEYGISNVWGLSNDKSSFITDTQWAAILGETGYLGVLFYSISILCILIIIFKISKIGMERLAIISIVLYGLISSISDSILVSFRGVSIFGIVALFITIKENMRKYSLNDNR